MESEIKRVTEIAENMPKFDWLAKCKKKYYILLLLYLLAIKSNAALFLSTG